VSRIEKMIIVKPFIYCCLVSALLLTLVTGVFASASVTPTSEQAGYVVTRQSVHDLKSLFAVIQTVDVTHARARIGGTLVELLVDEGDVVTAGQRLARVRDSKQNLQIAALASRLRSLDAQLQLANTTFKRVNKLYKADKMSESARDEAQTQVDVVTAEIAAIKGDQAVIRQSQIEGDVLVPNTSFRTMAVMEPTADKPVLRPQIMLVPLLAFDAAGYRLGYGGGYYDRTIQVARQSSAPFVAVGIACEFQRRESVPHDRHDQKLDWVITEETAMKTVLPV